MVERRHDIVRPGGRNEQPPSYGPPVSRSAPGRGRGSISRRRSCTSRPSPPRARRTRRSPRRCTSAEDDRVPPREHLPEARYPLTDRTRGDHRA
jgi:hypothetical protein